MADRDPRLRTETPALRRAATNNENPPLAPPLLNWGNSSSLWPAAPVPARRAKGGGEG